MSSKELEMKAQEHNMPNVSEEAAVETTRPTAEKIVTVYQKIEVGVVEGYKKIESGVVNGYKKMETSIVKGFGKITDMCVKSLFSREGESVEETKKRLSRKG